MNNNILNLIAALVIVFAFPAQVLAGLPLLDSNMNSLAVKEAQISKLSMTPPTPVRLNLITYKPLALEERNSLFAGWKNAVFSHKKKYQ